MPDPGIRISCADNAFLIVTIVFAQRQPTCVQAMFALRHVPVYASDGPGDCKLTLLAGSLLMRQLTVHELDKT